MPDRDEDRRPDEVVVPVIEEEVVTGVRPVTTGGVRVEKHVNTRTERIDLPLVREEVEVRRVPVHKIVSQFPETREEGDVLIVPIVEEELVVEKRLVLKEEIHISRKRYRTHVSKEVDVSRETAVVQRLDEHGRVARSQDEPAAGKRRRQKSILKSHGQH